jgi:hypothetical protein
MSYYRLMTSFFAYFSNGLAGLAAIFALMIWIIHSKRRFYGLTTLQTVVDAALAYLLFFIMTNSLKQAERSTFNYETNLSRLHYSPICESTHKYWLDTYG